MRYMFLIYGREHPAEGSAEELEQLTAAHWAVMDETRRRGIFHGAEPLKPTATATTVRMEGGKPLILDGPFAETKEQLAGYYILDCVQRRPRLHRDPADSRPSPALTSRWRIRPKLALPQNRSFARSMAGSS